MLLIHLDIKNEKKFTFFIALFVGEDEGKLILLNTNKIYMYKQNAFSSLAVNEFKAMVTLKNVTDNSILVDWTTVDISGVDVYYEVIFNITTLPNITSPPQLITNLSNGEVQSIQVTSIVKGRDDRIEIVMSDVSFIRTCK